MQELVDKLSLIHVLSRRQVFELLLDMANTSKDFSRALSITHTKSVRTTIKANNYKSLLGSSNKTLSEALEKLSNPNTRSVTLSSNLRYLVYTLCDEVIPKGTRAKLAEALGYTIPTSSKVNNKTPCTLCTRPTAKGDLCNSCKGQVLEFVEARRETFTVPVTFLNFKVDELDADTWFTLDFKDWSISKDNGIIAYNLKSALYNSPREDYTLPFVEYQKAILI